MTSTAVIEVLNANYQPLGNMSLNKAIRLLALEKAVVHEADETRERLREWLYPKVIRLVKFVKVNYSRLYGKADWSKRGVLKRDKHICGYCGGKATTIDHIHPKSRGGKNEWLNTISACFSCNNRKDNKTLDQVDMQLLWQPYVPSKAQLIGA